VSTIGRNYSKSSTRVVLERIHRIVHHTFSSATFSASRRPHCRSSPQLAFPLRICIHLYRIILCISPILLQDRPGSSHHFAYIIAYVNASEPCSSRHLSSSFSTLDRQFNCVRAQPVSQILLVPPCRFTGSDVSQIFILASSLSRKSTLASLGLKLVDIVTLFQVTSSLSSYSTQQSPSRRPLVPPDWTLISQYLSTCSIYDTAEQRQSHQPSTHPPFPPHCTPSITRSLLVSRMLRTVQ
jgi:hypothetical protein